MCDNSPKNDLEKTNSTQINDVGGLLSRTIEPDLSARNVLSTSFHRSKYNMRGHVVTADTELNTVGDDDTSYKFDGVIQVPHQSSVTTSGSWTAHSQHVESLGVTQHCVVCGEVANGHFFGAVVCLPCKSFFIRCTKGGEPCIQQQCYGKCDIKKQFRNRCQFCRYQQCLIMGMSRKEKPECIQPQEGQELCKVCGDLANGIHFGVFTCEGCKKFFRRGLKEHQSYVCKDINNCVLNPRNRNNCRSCRYKTCVNVGMSREAIKMGRPRKNYQNTRTEDIVLPMETSVRNPQDDADNDNKCRRITCYDDSREVVKIELEQEVSLEGGHDLRSNATWFHDDRPQTETTRRSSEDSHGLLKHQGEDAMIVHVQEESHTFKCRELQKSCSRQDCCPDKTYRECLRHQVYQPSLVHNRSLSRQNSASPSSEMSAHKTFLTSLSASQRLRNDSLADQNRHQQRRNDTYRREASPGPAHRVPEKRLHTQNSSPACKQRLLQSSRFGIINIDPMVAVRTKSTVNLSDFQTRTHMEESASISSHILSDYSVENYALKFSESGLSPLKPISQMLVSERKTDLAITNRQHNDFSETLNCISSQNRKSHWPQIRKDEPLELYNESRMNLCLDKHDLTDDDKVTKYEDLILDLSVNTKTHLADDNCHIKTKNFVCSGGKMGHSLYDPQNNHNWTKQRYDTNCRESTNQYFAHNTSQQSVYGQHDTDFKTFIHSVDNFRKCSPQAIEVSSFDKQMANECTYLKSDSPAPTIPQHEIANKCDQTECNSYCRTIQSPEIKSEILNSCHQQLLLTASSDHRTSSHLAGSVFESGAVKCEADCGSYSSTSVLTGVLSSSDVSPSSNSYPNTTIYKNNYYYRSTCELLKSTSISLSSRGALQTNKTSPGADSPRLETYPTKLLVEHIPRSLESIARDANDRSSEGNGIVKYPPEQRVDRKLGLCTKEQTIMYINEMFMVADTFTETLYSSTQRSAGDRISSELTAVDGMFTDVYGYSPIKVSHFWRNVYLSIPGVSSGEWRFVLTQAQLGWLSDVTQTYMEQVRACEEGVNMPGLAHDLWPLPEKHVDQWEHILDLLTRQTLAEAQFVLKLPDIDKIHPKDRAKLSNSNRLFGNTILMASREWFDPIRKKFRLFCNWKLSPNHPLSPFQNWMMRTGSLICNLNLDTTEVAILSALNIVGTEYGTFHNPSQISEHTETFIKVLGYYLYTINVDLHERIPELLSVMPKVRLMTMWHSNLIKNMKVNTSSM